MQYNHLSGIKAPKLIVNGLKLLGTREIVGKEHNPIILGWAKKVGLEKTYTNDEIPWCGLFVAYVCHISGYASVLNPLWARNWNNFGVKQTVAMLGDILVFSRAGGSGHVGFYIAEDDTCYHVLGGNQSNTVNITRILKSRCIGIRRCDWKIGQPREVKKYVVDAKGNISTNEQ